jgi:hypothetical protein
MPVAPLHHHPARPERVVTLLTLAVLVAHALALLWLASRWREAPALPLMGAPMLTRTISQQAPAAPPETPQPKVIPPQVRPAQPAITSIAKTTVTQTPTVVPKLPEPTPPANPPTAPAETQPTPNTALASGPGGNSGPPQNGFGVGPMAPPATTTSSTPQGSVTDVLASWPGDTRLRYRVSGQARGELFGDAQVLWQRDKSRYQVKIDVDVGLLFSRSFTSQGQVAPDGLRPGSYEETRARGQRVVAAVDDQFVTLNDGTKLPRPNGVQDTASQFVELSHQFATGRAQLAVGKTVELPLARPGGVNLWTYDIAEEVTLNTPRLGAVQAFHLKPRPVANPRGNINMEIWIAPTLQFLPAKIRINQDEKTYLDLLIDRIEQQ